MDRSHARYLERRHFAGLDGVRAIAILAVIWHHAPHPAGLPMMERGFMGVDLFFVLSGFLISTLLIREKAKTGRISLKNFWMRRLLRLVPAYYFVLIALTGAYLLLKPGDPDTARLAGGFPVYALYLSNWIHPGAPNLGPTWSLATEEQFYLVWPLFEAFASPLVMLASWAGALIFNQAINFGALDGAFLALAGGTGPLPEILDTTFTPILLGVGLAHALDHARTFPLVSAAAGFRFAPVAWGGLFIILLNIPVADISGLVRLCLHIAATGFIASIILQPEAMTTRALEFRPLAYIGMVSYGMYLYHMLCLYAAGVVAGKTGLPAFPTAFLLGVALTVMISSASYFLLERRFLDLRRKFRTERTLSDDHAGGRVHGGEQQAGE